MGLLVNKMDLLVYKLDLLVNKLDLLVYKLDLLENSQTMENIVVIPEGKMVKLGRSQAK